MGYKTKDPKEVTRLQVEGYNVIGIIQEKIETINSLGIKNVEILPNLIYEFNFDKKEEVKTQEIPLAEDNTLIKEEVKEVKKRGRKKREVKQ